MSAKRKTDSWKCGRVSCARAGVLSNQQAEPLRSGPFYRLKIWKCPKKSEVASVAPGKHTQTTDGRAGAGHGRSPGAYLQTLISIITVLIICVALLSLARIGTWFAYDQPDVAEFRAERTRDAEHKRQQAQKLDQMFANMEAGEVANLNLVLKTDVRGTLEALSVALQKLATAEVRVNLIAQGVGGITESDATLASSAGAIILGFNVRADAGARQVIERDGIELRYYSVIYDIVDDVKAAMSGILAPELREEIVGIAEVRDVFNSPKFGQIAGCMVVEGIIYRNKKIRVLRDNVVVYEGELESLRRFKDDVNEVRNGTECGIGVKNYTDVKPGDKIEVFDVREVARKI